MYWCCVVWCAVALCLSCCHYTTAIKQYRQIDVNLSAILWCGVGICILCMYFEFELLFCYASLHSVLLKGTIMTCTWSEWHKDEKIANGMLRSFVVTWIALDWLLAWLCLLVGRKEVVVLIQRGPESLSDWKWA